MKTFGWLVIAGLAGCSGFNLRSGPPITPGLGPDGSGPIPGTIEGEGAGGPVGSTQGSSRQTVCRSSSYPRGWVAVDYVEGGSSCGSADDHYSAAVLQRLAPLPIGTRLTVCTGQLIPGSWRRLGTEEAPSSGQCPRQPGDNRTGSTVMLIERMS